MRLNCSGGMERGFAKTIEEKNRERSEQAQHAQKCFRPKQKRYANTNELKDRGFRSGCSTGTLAGGCVMGRERPPTRKSKRQTDAIRILI